MKFFRTSPSPKLPAFHPDTVIRDLGDGDTFRIADAQTGVIALGATGSGKTSAIAKFLALGYMAAGFGGLVLCAKKEECRQWRQWAAEAGRESDLVIINAEGNWRFSFMEHEATRPGEGGGFSINIVALLDEISGAINRTGEGGGSYRFWELAQSNLNANSVGLAVLARLPVSLPLLREIVSSAPQSIEQLNDPLWKESSVCARVLNEADNATKNGDAEQRADFEECHKYWTQDFPTLAQETRSSIVINFSVMVRPLVTSPLRKLFSSDINIKPEDTFDGKIIIVDIPVQEYRLAGLIANLIWKYCMQVAGLRRVQPADRKSFLRPIFIWADEAQNFVSKFDSEFQAVARSAAVCTVYLTQNREGLRRTLRDNDAVDSLLGNLQAKFFCQNVGETNSWAAGLLGERYVRITSTNAGLSHQAQSLLQPNNSGNQSAGINRAEDKRFFLEPAVFTTLKRGGAHFNYRVEAICYNGGHLFGNGSGERLPFKRLTFNQLI